jgi:hypothetical protein
MAVKRRIEDPLGFVWSKANVVDISPMVGYVDTVVGNNNLIVHQLLEQKATSYPVLLTLFRKAAGSIIVSLRSRNGEAIKVAEQLQGGGHPNACGATLPRSVQNIPEAVDYLRKVLNPSAQKGSPLNSLESLFASIELEKRKQPASASRARLKIPWGSCWRKITPSSALFRGARRLRSCGDRRPRVFDAPRSTL